MPINKKIILALYLLMFAMACSKNLTSKSDNTPPVITIVSPLNNQHFNVGEIIQTTATVTDNDRIVELHIHVINTATGILLRDIHSYPGQSSATAEDSFAAEAGIGYTIKIIAYDAAHNLATAQVDVSVN